MRAAAQKIAREHHFLVLIQRKLFLALRSLTLRPVLITCALVFFYGIPPGIGTEMGRIRTIYG